MLSNATSTVNDIERLLLQTLPGIEVRIRANAEGCVIVDVCCDGHLLAHQRHETLAGAAQLALGTEAVQTLLRDARPDRDPAGHTTVGEPTTNATTQTPPSQSETVNLSAITRAPLTGDSFETFANFFIIAAASMPGLDTARRVFSGDRDKIEKAKICLTINGVQLPFLTVLRRFHEDWERIVRAEAAKLLEEKFSSKTSDIFNLLEDLKQRLEEAVASKTEISSR